MRRSQRLGLLAILSASWLATSSWRPAERRSRPRAIPTVGFGSATSTASTAAPRARRRGRPAAATGRTDPARHATARRRRPRRADTVKSMTLRGSAVGLAARSDPSPTPETVTVTDDRPRSGPAAPRSILRRPRDPERKGICRRPSRLPSGGGRRPWSRVGGERHRVHRTPGRARPGEPSSVALLGRLAGRVARRSPTVAGGLRRRRCDSRRNSAGSLPSASAAVPTAAIPAGPRTDLSRPISLRLRTRHARSARAD